MENGTRRYFNLAGVVRDLEHLYSGERLSAEGEDLKARWEALASALDAESESEDEDESHAGDDPDVGDEELDGGGQDDRRPRRHDDGSDEMRHRLAALESALANLQRPESEVPNRTPAVDGARTRATPVNGRIVTGTMERPLNPPKKPAPPRPARKKRRAKTTRKTR